LLTVSAACRIRRVVASNVARVTFAFAVASLLVASRFPLTPSVLVTFDAANFAFALEDFDPALHKPQPPGYPLYVGLTRVLHIFINDLPTLFTVSGILGTLAAVLALARLAEDLLGWRAAIAAGVLLTFHPALWSAGLLNPVRVFLAAASACVALLAWRAWSPGSHRAWIIGAWAALGLFSGFRPTVAILLAPLCVAAGGRRRTTPLDWLYCGLALSSTVAAWVGVCSWSVGGLQAYLSLLRDYSDQQFSDTSLLFGAPLAPALKMAGRALIWSLAPSVCWLWFLFLAPVSTLSLEIRRVGAFFLLWMLPPLLFATLFHSAEPGHVLSIVTPVCLAGALVAAVAVCRWQNPLWTIGSIAVAGLAGIALFFHPPTNVLRVTSAEAVRLQERRVAPALALLDRVSKQEPVTAIGSPTSSVPWRVLAYYHPEIPVIVVHPGSGANSKPSYWVMREGRLQTKGTDKAPVPCSGAQLWFLSDDSGAAVPGTEEFQRIGSALVTRANVGTQFRVSGLEFAPALPCPPLVAQD
jgi:hypothetical protein